MALVRRKLKRLFPIPGEYIGGLEIRNKTTGLRTLLVIPDKEYQAILRSEKLPNDFASLVPDGYVLTGSGQGHSLGDHPDGMRKLDSKSGWLEDNTYVLSGDGKTFEAKIPEAESTGNFPIEEVDQEGFVELSLPD